MKTIFNGLNERAISFGINVANSGYILENTQFPHISIQQIASTPWQDDSFISRIEENIYQFSIYTDNFDENQDYQQTIKDNFSFGTLDIDYRRFSSMFYDNHMFREEKPGIYHSIIALRIYTERAYTDKKNYVSSLRFFDGIQTINEQNLKAIMILGFQLENQQMPYIGIGQLNSVETDAHSKGYLSNNNFSFFLYDNNLDSLEKTIDNVHVNYDYCIIDILNEKTLTIQWLMNSILEIEPGIWRAKMDYLSTQEELISDSIII